MDVDVLLENLIKILEFEKRYYLKLIDISTKKTDIIIKGDIVELKNITEQEQIMVSQILKGEQTRISIVEQLAKIFKVDSENLTVTQIIDKIGSKHRKKISDKRLEMKRSIEELKSINDKNSELIKNAIDYIDFSINLLTGAGVYSTNYSGFGEGRREQSRSLLDLKL